MVAVSDFLFGAMENWGLVTYRNGYIITWILHQIFIFSSEVNLQRAKISIPHSNPTPFPPTGCTN